MVRAPSMITPKLRTRDDGVIHAPAMNRGVIGQRWSCPADPSQMISVFEGLSFRRFEAIQLLTASTQSENRVTRSDDLSGLTCAYICKSSAYACTLKPCSSMIVYRRKNSGPSTEPCGIPHTTDVTDEALPLKNTYIDLDDRYDFIQSRTRPVNPKACSSLSKSIWWSTTSNAELWSSMPSNVTWPESAASYTSDSTSMTAVSVEWCLLYADCFSGRSPLSFRYSCSCVYALRSSILDRYVRFDTGL